MRGCVGTGGHCDGRQKANQLDGSGLKQHPPVRNRGAHIGSASLEVITGRVHQCRRPIVFICVFLRTSARVGCGGRHEKVATHALPDSCLIHSPPHLQAVAGVKALTSVVRRLDVVRRAALTVSQVEMQESDCYLLGTPANFGCMSGALKHYLVDYPAFSQTGSRCHVY